MPLHLNLKHSKTGILAEERDALNQTGQAFRECCGLLLQGRILQGMGKAGKRRRTTSGLPGEAGEWILPADEARQKATIP